MIDLKSKIVRCLIYIIKVKTLKVKRNMLALNIFLAVFYFVVPPSDGVYYLVYYLLLKHTLVH